MSDYPILGQITFLRTADLAVTRSFYVGSLGLKMAYDDAGCQIYQVGASAYIGFCQSDEVPNEKDTFVFTLLVESKDVDRWYDELKARGIKFESPPHKIEKYGIYTCFLRDPNGYRLEIQSFLSPFPR